MHKGAIQDSGAIAQIINRLEKRHDGQISDTHLFTEKLHFKQIAERTCHANDVAGDGLCAELFLARDVSWQSVQHMARLRAQMQVRRGQDTRVTQQAFQDTYPLILIQRHVIVGAQTGDAQQFGQRGGVSFAMLAHIEGGKMEAEDLHRAYQRRQLPLRYSLFTIRQQTLLNKPQVSKQLCNGGVRNGFDQLSCCLPGSLQRTQARPHK